MQEIATLGLALDSSQLRQGTSALNDVEKAGNRAADALDDAGKRGSEGLNSIASAAGIVKTAVAAWGLDIAIKQLYDADVALNSIKSTLSVALGPQAGSGLTFIRQEAQRLGLDLRTTAQDFANLQASAIGTKLAGAGAASIFSSVAEAATALHLPVERTNSLFLALEQMMSKGTVQAQELHLQFGQAIPGAMTMAAQAMGVTVQQLNLMMASGQLLATDMLPKLAAVLHDRFGPAAAAASDNLLANTQKLTTAFFNLKNELNASGGDALLNTAAKDLTSLVTTVNANLPQIITLGEAVGAIFVARSAGPLIAQMIAAASSTALMAASTLKAADAEAMYQAAAIKSAQAALGRAQAAEAVTAAEVSAWQAVVADTKAEIELEKVRIAAQITENGRVATIERMVVASETAASAQNALAIAETNLARAQATTAAASAAAAVATSRGAAAVEAATIGSRALAAGLGLARGAMAALGGPIGLAITGLSLLYLWMHKSGEEAPKMAESATDAIHRLAEAARAAQSGAPIISDADKANISKVQADIQNYAATIAQLYQQRSQAAASGDTKAVVAFDGAIGDLQGKINGLAQDLNDMSGAAKGADLKPLSNQVMEFQKRIDQSNQDLAMQISLMKQGVSADEAARVAKLQAGGATEQQIKLNDQLSMTLERLKVAQKAAAESGPQQDPALSGALASAEDAKLMRDMALTAAQANNTLFSSEQALYDISQRRLDIDSKSSNFHDGRIKQLEAESNVYKRQTAALEDFMKAQSETTRLNVGFGFDEQSQQLGAFVDTFSDLIDIQKKHNQLVKDAAGNQAQLNQESFRYGKDQIATYGSMAGAAKGFFKQGSAGYKTLQAAETAYRAVELAMSVKSIAQTLLETGVKVAAPAEAAAANIATVPAVVGAEAVKATAAGTTAAAIAAQSSPWTGLATMAAMVAALAAIGVGVKGGGGGASIPTGNPNEGTGTVLGDPTKASESIANALDQLGNYANRGLEYSQQMLMQLRAINAGINGVGNLLYQQNLTSGGPTPFNMASSSRGLFGAGTGGTHDKIVGGLNRAAADFYTLGLNELMGNAIGGFLDSIVGSIASGIYHSKTSQTSSGILFAAGQSIGDVVSKGIVDASYYAVINTTKRVFGLKTSSTDNQITQGLDTQTQTQFTKIIQGLGSTVLLGVQALHGDLTQAQALLNATSLDLGAINLQGLSDEDVQKKLAAVFSALGDRMALAIAGALPNINISKFQAVGEGLLQTLARVASDYEYATLVTTQLHIQMVQLNDSFASAASVATELIRASIDQAESAQGVLNGVGKMIDAFDGSADDLVTFYQQLLKLRTGLQQVNVNGADLTQTMINAAGGIDGLQSGLDTYFDGFFSDTEKAAAKTATMTSEFARLGLTLPSSRTAFRQLVDSIDTSTDAGQSLLGNVLALAGGFDDLEQALDAANQAQQDLQKTLDDARQSTALPEQQLQTLLDQFNSTYAQALTSTGADLQTQAESLNSQISPLLDKIASVYASGQQAQDLRDNVLTAGDIILQLLKGQAGGDLSAVSLLDGESANSTLSTSDAQNETITQLQEQNAHLAALVNLQQDANTKLLDALNDIKARLESIESASRLEAASP